MPARHWSSPPLSLRRSTGSEHCEHEDRLGAGLWSFALELPPIQRGRLVIERARDDPLVLHLVPPHRVHRDRRRALRRKSVDACRNSGEGDGAHVPRLTRTREALLVGAIEQLGLALAATIPDWPDGVDDVSG